MDLDNEELMVTKNEKGLLKKDLSKRVVELAKLRKELDDIMKKGQNLSEYTFSDDFKKLDKKEQFLIIQQFNGMSHYKMYLEKRINYMKEVIFGDDTKGKTK